MSRPELSGFVERLLADRIGLDPSSVGEGLIARGVQARMRALGLASKADYERILPDQAGEIQALVEEVVVSESWFFRDDRPFAVLDRFAREGWLSDRNRPPLSVLSIPCAAGEEPYSIAMTLLQAGLASDRFRVDAVDVSERALSKAIAGVYSPNSFRGTPPTLRSTYFREQNNAFTLDLSVRSTVHFHLGNLLDTTLFADRPPFDAVFCRNVLIYLDDESRTRAFANLGRLIANGGLLFLGHADRVDQPESSPFRPTGESGGFAFRKGDVKATAVPVKVARVVPVARKPAPSGVVRPATPPQPNPPPQGGRGPEKAKALPQTVAPEKSEPPAKTPDTTLDRASELADLGRYEEASSLVERRIFQGGACPRAFFLLGLIAQASGARDRAEAHYLKALYLDPHHDEALLALAVLARRKGDIVAEASFRKRADRVLARKDVP